LEVEVPRLIAGAKVGADHFELVGEMGGVEDGEEAVGGEVVEVDLIKGTYPLDEEGFVLRGPGVAHHFEDGGLGWRRVRGPGPEGWRGHTSGDRRGRRRRGKRRGGRRRRGGRGGGGGGPIFADFALEGEHFLLDFDEHGRQGGEHDGHGFEALLLSGDPSIRGGSLGMVSLLGGGGRG
jgi:hypothetical protein